MKNVPEDEEEIEEARLRRSRVWFEEKNMVEPYFCWVNPELFLPEMELRLEYRNVSGVHKVNVDDGAIDIVG